MNHTRQLVGAAFVVGAVIFGTAAFVNDTSHSAKEAPYDAAVKEFALRALEEGKQTFRFDTFGDEAFWGDLLQLHLAIAGEDLGGVGPGVSPRTALDVGLKVDSEALPKSLLNDILKGRVDLDDPAVTLELLRLNAVVGVTGFFEGQNLSSMGIQCALCHSSVDNSVAPGIGRRLDGWANRDLNVGAIVALAPNLEPFADLLGVHADTVRAVLGTWGPGKFDAELVLDGKAFQSDRISAATLIPPAFGMAGVNLHTWTGWGSVTHWNAFVANLEMHGQGTFYDPRLNDATRFPIAAREGFGNVRNTPDLITPKLAALHLYQLSLPAPKPPDDFFDAAAAERGADLFTGKAKCATCHVPPLFTEPGWNMHTPAEIGIDDFQAERSPDRRYRTPPLKGLWTHMDGGFYHDGRFATLGDVVDHYNTFFGFGLTTEEKDDLEEYLKSLGDEPAPGVVLASDASSGIFGGESAGGAELDVQLVSPNPTRGEVVLELTIPTASVVDAFVFDAAGRRVATLRPEGSSGAGSQRLVWDGRVSAGGRAAPGIYFVRIAHPGGEWTEKVVLTGN